MLQQNSDRVVTRRSFLCQAIPAGALATLPAAALLPRAPDAIRPVARALRQLVGISGPTDIGTAAFYLLDKLNIVVFYTDIGIRLEEWKIRDEDEARLVVSINSNISVDEESRQVVEAVGELFCGVGMGAAFRRAFLAG